MWFGKCSEEMVRQTQESPNMVSRVVLSTHVYLKSGKIDDHDMIGGGNETFDRVMTAVRKKFDFGAWDIGSFRFKGRQTSQMPNVEIVFDMEN